MSEKKGQLSVKERIIQAGVGLYLKHGFYQTTNRMIAEAADVRVSVLNNTFRTKEDLLLELVNHVVRYQYDLVSADLDDQSPIFTYGMEAAVEIMMCERFEKVGELYRAAYSLPKTLECIKQFSYRKSKRILKDYLRDWTELEFYNAEIVASGIIFGCMMEKCDARFTPRQKISLCLEYLFRVYSVAEEERREIIGNIMASDLEAKAETLLRSIMEQEVPGQEMPA